MILFHGGESGYKQLEANSIEDEIKELKAGKGIYLTSALEEAETYLIEEKNGKFVGSVYSVVVTDDYWDFSSVCGIKTFLNELVKLVEINDSFNRLCQKIWRELLTEKLRLDKLAEWTVNNYTVEESEKELVHNLFYSKILWKFPDSENVFYFVLKADTCEFIIEKKY